jgi:hypothetical protein
MKLWRLWAKSLGEKASKCNKESDKIALIRTFIFVSYLITNAFIIAGVVRHWNDNQPDSKYHYSLKYSNEDVLSIHGTDSYITAVKC